MHSLFLTSFRYLYVLLYAYYFLVEVHTEIIYSFYKFIEHVITGVLNCIW